MNNIGVDIYGDSSCGVQWASINVVADWVKKIRILIQEGHFKHSHELRSANMEADCFANWRVEQ